MSATSAVASVSERLSSVLFLVALFHGIVILGVTFSSEDPGDDRELPVLKVTLVTESSANDSAEAEFLAAATNEGGGEAALGERPTAAPAAADTATVRGDLAGRSNTDARPEDQAPDAELLITRNPAPQQVVADPKPNEDIQQQSQRAMAQLNAPAPPTTIEELAETTELDENRDRELVISPATRESSLADYLNAWRQRVERIGTINFPQYASAQAPELRPTLEVAINADGDLKEIVVRRSSGDSRLDAAALEILRLSSPFEPLPEAIRSQYDVLRFAYDWEFSSGALAEPQASPTAQVLE